MRRLYHFTSTQHLPRILRAGYLKTVESNVGSPVPWMPPTGDHVGPDVVWLLDTPDLGAYEHGIVTPVTGRRKTEVRFTLRCSAKRWLDWPHADKMDPDWRATMISTGGGPDAVRHWYVSERRIPRAEWLRVCILHDSTWNEINIDATRDAVDKLRTAR